MNLMTTFKGSLMEGFLPAGWDLLKIDRLAAAPRAELTRREAWWHQQFEPRVGNCKPRCAAPPDSSPGPEFQARERSRALRPVLTPHAPGVIRLITLVSP